MPWDIHFIAAHKYDDEIMKEIKAIAPQKFMSVTL